LTVGSWTDLPEVAKQQMKPHLGQVVSVQVHEQPDGASGTRYADITIAYPDANFSQDLAALLVTTFGKLSMDGKIKLLDLQPSSDFLAALPGPKFGTSGVRDLWGVHDRTLLMSIFKSATGYDLDHLREQFLQQALGGVDLIKDDEILFENPLTPIGKRVPACMEAARQAEAETGQKLIYFANLTGPTFGLRDQALRAGGGVHDHPGGAAAGGRAFRQAIEASQAGIPLETHAASHPELKTAIERWGVRTA
jgi:2,3-diketo-5-methylthiopentyl-1-phosphate enolase